MQESTICGRQSPACNDTPHFSIHAGKFLLGLAALSLLAAGCYQSPVAVTMGCPGTPIVHHGRATYYDATGNGACDDSSDNLMVGAMNTVDYAGSQICGATVVVTGPKGTIRIRIVDACPGCSPGGIDLSPEAFSLIGDTALGSVPITWYVAASNVTGPIVYHFKSESSQYWTAVQIRNHRYPVSTLQYVAPDGKFTDINRTTYNYFVVPNGMGTGPYIFRVTDIYGHSLIDSSIALEPGQDVPGKEQFAACGN